MRRLTTLHPTCAFQPHSTLLSTIPNSSRLATESIKTSLGKIMAHMESQTVTPIDVQGPTMSGDARDWSLTSHFQFREWNMPDGLYTFNLLVQIDSQDSGPNEFMFLVSLQVQMMIYHLYRLRQVDIDDRSGKYNYGLYEGVNSALRRGDRSRERARYLDRLTEYLEHEQERYERAGVWDFSNNFGGNELVRFLNESNDGPEL
jgi:hypothetical protein